MYLGKLAALLVVFTALVAGPAGAAGGGGGGGGGGGFSTGPSVDVGKLYREGVEHLRMAEYEEAQRKFKKVLRAVPDNAQANYLMGLAKAGEGDAKGSARYFKKAIRNDRHMYGAYVELGKAYLAQGRVEDANEQLAKLEKLASKCDGDCNQASLQNAQTALQAAINGGASAPPDQSSLLFNREADPEGAYLAAVGLINAGAFKPAIAELNSLLDAIGPHADVLNYLGYTHRKLGYFEDAYRYYRQALAVDPAHRGAHEYLGELYMQTGDRDKALKQLEKLAELCPFGCAEYDDLAFEINAVRQAAE